MIKKYLAIRATDDGIVIGQNLNTSFLLEGDSTQTIKILEILKESKTVSEAKKRARNVNLSETGIEEFIERYKSIPIWENSLCPDEKNKTIIFASQFTKLPYDFFEELKSKHILILGLGGVGTNVVFGLALMGFRKFTLFDSDLIEQSNIFRSLVFEESDVGKLKIQILRERLLAKFESIIVNCNSKQFACDDLSNLSEVPDVFVLTADESTQELVSCISQYVVAHKSLLITGGAFEDKIVIGPSVSSDFTFQTNSQTKARQDVMNYNSKLLNTGTFISTSMVGALIVNEIFMYFLTGRLRYGGKQIILDI